MNTTFGRFILRAEALTPSGMNLDISLSVAQADLDCFDHRLGDEDQRYTCARAEFIEARTPAEKCIEMIIILINALVVTLPPALKPLPLLLSVPASIDKNMLQKALKMHPSFLDVSSVKITHNGGARFVQEALEYLNTQDLALCIAVDSLFDNLDTLIKEKTVFSTQNPWGIIPSEGGAGLVMAKKNVVDTFKLTPLARFEYFDMECNTQDRRAMMRLARKAALSLPSLGRVYSNMTDTRGDTEDYAFALAAKGELFTQPQQPYLINALWGTLGGGSALALLAVFTQVHTDSNLASLLMFDQNGDRALLGISRCFE